MQPVVLFIIMKKEIVLAILVILSFKSFSQGLFENTLKFNGNSWITNIEKHQDFFYLSLVIQDQTGLYSRFFKMDQSGNFVDSVDILKYDSTNQEILNYYSFLDNNDFRLVGLAYQNQDVFLYHKKYDSNFRLIEDKKNLIDTIARNDVRNIFARIDAFGHIFCAITTMTFDESRPKQIFVKLNNSGDTIKTIHYSYPGFNCSWDFVEKDKYYYCTAYSAQHANALNSIGQIFVFNQALNLLNVIPISNNLFWDHNIMLYKNKILLSGRKPDNLRFEVRLTDTSFQPIFKTYTISRTEPYNYPANHNLSIAPDSTIFFGGTLNVDFVPEDDYIVNSQLVLARLDSNLNPIWQKTYGGETSYYMSNILATDDGGCIMTAGRYRLHNDSIRRDVYILKVDKWGNTVSEITRPVPGNAINAYPNPAKDLVRFEMPPLHGEVTIEISNLAGQMVQNSTLINPNLNVAGLKPGVYVYRVLVNGRKVFTGKLVKE